jgi:hypothetical protein
MLADGAAAFGPLEAQRPGTSIAVDPQAARPARGLRLDPGVRIDADGKGRGIGGRRSEDGRAVPRSQVDDGPAMSPGQSGQLADVDLDDPAAGHDAHGAQYAIRPAAPG